jgi:hypothetical protein
VSGGFADSWTGYEPSIALRNYWAVRMARSGAPVELVARQLGHRDVALVAKVDARFKGHGGAGSVGADRFGARCRAMESPW